MFLASWRLLDAKNLGETRVFGLLEAVRRMLDVRWGQDGPKRFQDGSKGVQDGTKMFILRLKSGEKAWDIS